LNIQLITITISVVLSGLWLVAAVQDLRTGKIKNWLTLSAFLVALCFQIALMTPIPLSPAKTFEWAEFSKYALGLLVSGGIVIFLLNTDAVFAGGDAKLLLSLLAWEPGVNTWIVTAVCIGIIGGLVFGVCWIVSKVKKQTPKKTFPLGGILSLAGLFVVWVL